MLLQAEERGWRRTLQLEKPKKMRQQKPLEVRRHHDQDHGRPYDHDHPYDHGQLDVQGLVAEESDLQLRRRRRRRRGWW